MAEKKKYADEGEEYELLPHHEIAELKEELRKLKEFEITPTKKLHTNLVEVNHKLDKLLTVFEEATTALHIEEGGLGFKEKIKPLVERMNKILQQNSEIAQGIVAVADIVRDMKEELASKGIISRGTEMRTPMPMMRPSRGPAPPARGAPARPVPGTSPPPRLPPPGPAQHPPGPAPGTPPMPKKRFKP